MSLFKYSEVSLVSLIKNYLGSPLIVIRGYQGAPEPDNDYLVVTAMDLIDIGGSETKSFKSGEVFEEASLVTYQIPVTITGYGETSYDLLQSLKSKMKLNSFLDYAHGEFGLSIKDTNNVNIKRIPELRGTQYVQRCEMEVNLMVSVYFSRGIDWFNTVRYEGEYQNVDGRVVLIENETVSANDKNAQE